MPRGDFFRFLAGAAQGGLQGYQLIRALERAEQQNAETRRYHDATIGQGREQIGLQREELSANVENRRQERIQHGQDTLGRRAATQGQLLSETGVIPDLGWLQGVMGRGEAQDVDLGDIGRGVPVSLQGARDSASTDMTKFLTAADEAGTLQPGERRAIPHGLVYRKPEPSVTAAGLRTSGKTSALLRQLLNNPGSMAVVQAFAKHNPQFQTLLDEAMRELAEDGGGVRTPAPARGDANDPQPGETAQQYADRVGPTLGGTEARRRWQAAGNR